MLRPQRRVLTTIRSRRVTARAAIRCLACCIHPANHCNGLRYFLLRQPQAFVFLFRSCPLSVSTLIHIFKNRKKIAISPASSPCLWAGARGGLVVLVHATFWPPSHSHSYPHPHPHPCPRSGSSPTGRGRGERRGRRRPREGGARGSALTGALRAGSFPRAPLGSGSGALASQAGAERSGERRFGIARRASLQRDELAASTGLLVFCEALAPARPSGQRRAAPSSAE